MRRTSLLGALLLHAAHAMRVATPQRRHVLKGCGLAIATPWIANADDEPVATEAPVVEAPPPPPPAKTSAIDDARDRAKRYAEFSKTLRRTYDKSQLNAAYAEMVSFEKELARIAPTKEAAEGAKDLKKVLRDLYDAAKRDDRRVVQKKVGEVSDAVSCVAAWKSTGESGQTSRRLRGGSAVKFGSAQVLGRCLAISQKWRRLPRRAADRKAAERLAAGAGLRGRQIANICSLAPRVPHGFRRRPVRDQ